MTGPLTCNTDTANCIRCHANVGPGHNGVAGFALREPQVLRVPPFRAGAVRRRLGGAVEMPSDRPRRAAPRRGSSALASLPGRGPRFPRPPRLGPPRAPRPAPPRGPRTAARARSPTSLPGAPTSTPGPTTGWRRARWSSCGAAASRWDAAPWPRIAPHHAVCTGAHARVGDSFPLQEPPRPPPPKLLPPPPPEDVLARRRNVVELSPVPLVVFQAPASESTALVMPRTRAVDLSLDAPDLRRSPGGASNKESLDLLARGVPLASWLFLDLDLRAEHWPPGRTRDSDPATRPSSTCGRRSSPRCPRTP